MYNVIERRKVKIVDSFQACAHHPTQNRNIKAGEVIDLGIIYKTNDVLNYVAYNEHGISFVQSLHSTWYESLYCNLEDTEVKKKIKILSNNEGANHPDGSRPLLKAGDVVEIEIAQESLDSISYKCGNSTNNLLKTSFEYVTDNQNGIEKLKQINEQVKPRGPHACKCDFIEMLKYGCKCNGI